MYNEGFADCRAEFAKLKSNLRRYVRLDSKQTGYSHLRFQRQQWGEHRSRFACKDSFLFFRQIMAQHFEYAVGIALTLTSNPARRARFRLRDELDRYLIAFFGSETECVHRNLDQLLGDDALLLYRHLGRMQS